MNVLRGILGLFGLVAVATCAVWGLPAGEAGLGFGVLGSGFWVLG